MDKDNQQKIAEERRKEFAKTEKAYLKWLMQTTPWRPSPRPNPVEPTEVSGKTKLIIVLVIVLLLQLMWQRSTVESPVTDELIGMSVKHAKNR